MTQTLRAAGAAALPVRFVALFDPRGRGEALDARFARLTRPLDGPGWCSARLDGRAAQEDPAARHLRALVQVPRAAEEDPAQLIRHCNGRLVLGFARLHAPRGPRPGPIAASATDLDAVAQAEAAGRFARVSAGPAALEGDFAVAILDPDAPELILLRDATGHAPLHLARLPDGMVAASDGPHPLRALDEIGRDPDPDRLRLLMAFRHLPAGETPWPGLEEVPRAGRLRFGPDGAGEQAAHHAWGADPTLSGLGEADMLEALRLRAAEAVLQRAERIGARPAVMFSGGLDSSLVAGVMCRADPERPVEAWHVGSAAGRAPEEAEARAAMARRWPNLVVNALPAEGLDPLDGAETVWQAQALPNPDAFAYTRFALFRAMAEAGHDSLIGGQAGDRLVSLHLTAKLREDLISLRLGGAREEVRALRAVGLSPRGILRLCLVNPSRPFEWLRRVRPGGEILNALAFAPGPVELARWRRLGLPPWIRRQRSVRAQELAEMATLPPWTFQDPLLPGPASGGPPVALGYGAPWVDTRLAGAVMAAPRRMKTRDGLGRGVIRALLEDVAPPEIVRRRDKSPFQPDWAEHIAAALPRLRARMADFADRPLWRATVDPDRVRAALDRLEHGPPGLAAHRIAMTAHFLGEFCERVETRNPAHGP